MRQSGGRLRDKEAGPGAFASNPELRASKTTPPVLSLGHGDRSASVLNGTWPTHTASPLTPPGMPSVLRRVRPKPEVKIDRTRNANRNARKQLRGFQETKRIKMAIRG